MSTPAKEFESAIFLTPTNVRLKVTAEVMAALEKSPLSNNQILLQHSDGFIVESEMSITANLIHWIYASGCDVQVLAPLQLRELIRNGISSALNEYRLV